MKKDQSSVREQVYKMKSVSSPFVVNEENEGEIKTQEHILQQTLQIKNG